MSSSIYLEALLLLIHDLQFLFPPIELTTSFFAPQKVVVNLGMQDDQKAKKKVMMIAASILGIVIQLNFTLESISLNHN